MSGVGYQMEISWEWDTTLFNIKLLLYCFPVPGPVAEITYQIISDTEILVSWREPEMTNGLVLHYHINVTLYSTGQTVYTNVVPGGGDLSDSVTGLGKTHGGKICPLSSSLWEKISTKIIADQIAANPFCQAFHLQHIRNYSHFSHTTSIGVKHKPCIGSGKAFEHCSTVIGSIALRKNTQWFWLDGCDCCCALNLLNIVLNSPYWWS